MTTSVLTMSEPTTRLAFGAVAPRALAPLAIATLPLLGACVPEGPPTTREERALPAPSWVPTVRDVDPMLDGTFRDAFDRPALGPSWRALSGRWQLIDGELCGRAARNQGVWLRRRLPPNVRIAFDARADDEEGDLKVEVFGDGKSGASGTTYDDASGYVLIFGGWQNQKHVLARGDEHGDDRLVSLIAADGDSLRTRAVQPHRAYRFRIEREGGDTLRWFVDDELIHELVDDDPLSGTDHDHFGFNNWNAPVCFDNLEVSPL